MTQSRWKSKVLWASIVAQLIALGQLTGLWAVLGVDAGQIGDITAIVLGLLSTIGIINNPRDKAKF